GVALAVAAVLHVDVVAERHARTELVDLHGVVDHQLCWLERVDLLRITPHALHRIAHRSEIDDGGHTREVLQQHARRREADLAPPRPLRIPFRHGLDALARPGEPVLVAQEVLEQDAERVWQPADRITGTLYGIESKNVIAVAADVERRSGVEVRGI